jgi:hypothetical protein
MNTPCLALEVLIVSTHNDACVVWLGHMESHEVTTIPSENRSAIGSCNPQDLIIARAPVRPASLACRDRVMPETPKYPDDPDGEVLVGEQSSHGLGRSV